MKRIWLKLMFTVVLSFLLTIMVCIAVYATENAMFPMEYLSISQGVNGSYSHQGTLALDVYGKDTGIDAFPAPFTGTVKKIYATGNTVWLESNEPVRFADGTIDYMTIMCIHDNNVSDLWVGKVIAQGSSFLHEGTKGNATGNHIHFECGRGKFTGSGWYENNYGKWCINNGINPWDALMLADWTVPFLGKPTVIKEDYGYNWRYASQFVQTTPPSNPILRGYQSEIPAGQPYLFEYSVNNAERMYIAIDVNGVREHFIEVSGDHYNGTFTKPGRYECYLYTTNSAGNSGLSNCVAFDVYNTAPQNPTLSILKNSVSMGSTQTFYFNAKYAVEYQLGINLEDKRIYTSDRMTDKQFSMKLTTPGHYRVYVSSYNFFGYCDSSKLEFDVIIDKSNSKQTILYNKNQYLLFDIEASWETASLACKNLGGHLVSITDQEESNIISELMKHGEKGSCWIGCTDKETEGIWKWENGEPFQYTNWRVGEPNNDGGNENYASVEKNNGQWNDLPESFLTGFICEIEDAILEMESNVILDETTYQITTNYSDAVYGGIYTVALYNEDHVLLKIYQWDTEGTKNHQVGVNQQSNADYIKVFLWDEDGRPLAKANTLPL